MTGHGYDCLVVVELGVSFGKMLKFEGLENLIPPGAHGAQPEEVLERFPLEVKEEVRISANPSRAELDRKLAYLRQKYHGLTGEDKHFLVSCNVLSFIAGAINLRVHPGATYLRLKIGEEPARQPNNIPLQPVSKLVEAVVLRLPQLHAFTISALHLEGQGTSIRGLQRINDVMPAGRILGTQQATLHGYADDAVADVAAFSGGGESGQARVHDEGEGGNGSDDDMDLDGGAKENDHDGVEESSQAEVHQNIVSQQDIDNYSFEGLIPGEMMEETAADFTNVDGGSLSEVTFAYMWTGNDVVDSEGEGQLSLDENETDQMLRLDPFSPVFS